MATHSSTLAWKIPWMEEHGRQRVGVAKSWTRLSDFTSLLQEIVPWYLILLFSSISLHHSLKKAFLTLLAILWNSAFSWICLSLSPLPFASVLLSGTCKASSDNHFAFLHFFFLRMVLVTASYTMLRTSTHSSSGTLSDLIPWIDLSLPLCNHKGFGLGHTWMA